MKDNQHEQLFTELTSAEAEIIEGGRLAFMSNVSFNFSQFSQTFTVPNGDDVLLGAHVSGGDDGRYVAYLINVDKPYDFRYSAALNVGADSTIWRNLPGGTYLIGFRDNFNSKVYSGFMGVHTGKFA